MTGRDFLRVLEGNANYRDDFFLAVEPLNNEIGCDVGCDGHQENGYERHMIAPFPL